ncbi:MULTISPECIES: EAL domain-containing protein [unclassified Methylophaga]|jgi:diguanylate cyclase (GGDEF)-like protein/PAS domain S-box-containing protein|uniref:EAL domain-containing protein n=4 Tax=Methylophaga TaxID=40222 RepID=UPI00259C8D53|nr:MULTISPECIES: EAL domain-containing protein [unclassified Methylophaga]|tara:strand:- start:669 stop:3065 length:2397 start_codon:yes stop_codon:yes gene_type:complete
MDDQEILRKQADRLFEEALFSNLTVIGVSILIVTVLFDYLQSQSLLLVGWSSAICLLSISRLAVLFLYKKHNALFGLSAKGWMTLYTFLTGCVGTVWGLASIFYIVIDDIQINTLFYILISTVVAAAVPVLSAWFPTFLAYTIPQLVLLTSMSLYQIQTVNVDKLAYILTVGFIAYYLLMFSMARRANQNLIKSLKLQESNQYLLTKLNNEMLQREELIKERTKELSLSNDKLKASQEHMLKLSRAVESSPNPILITDANGTIEYVNKRCEKLSGYTAVEMHGQRLETYKSNKMPSAFFDEIWHQTASEGQWSGEIENCRKDGSHYWVKLYLAAVYDDQKNINHYVAIYEDITESRKLAKKLSFQATHDDLTGLINRTEFERRLSMLVNDAQRIGTEHALCFLDLDQFKVINDTCGHIAGDELLRQLGSLLGGSTRKSDTLARLGGDEFAILVEDCELEKAEFIANEIKELVSQFQFIWETQVFTVGVSIGVTTITSATRNRTEALKQADSACYAAKNSGRNRVYVYQEQDQQLTAQKGEFKWVNEIKEALIEDRFELYAQPIVSTETEHLAMYEVLVRLRSKAGQLFPPGAFLSSAERYNLSDRIDKWVVSHVFEWLEQHYHSLPHLNYLAINLSGASIGDEGMLAYIRTKLSAASFNQEVIKFEITETAAIANLKQAHHFINSVLALGCQFSLDDFGSGLSSFAYLKNLPVQSIKIDGMFVKDMHVDPLDYEMVKSINDIGHVMGLETIAEFVESEEIWQKLKAIGVNYGQGYHLGKPAPIDQILQYSENRAANAE